jgi:hypothetical protein
VFIAHQRGERGIQMPGLNPAGTEIAPVEVAGKIAVPS